MKKQRGWKRCCRHLFPVEEGNEARLVSIRLSRDDYCSLEMNTCSVFGETSPVIHTC